MPQYSNDIIENWGAPGLSKFSEALIPDVSIEFDQCKYWIQNHWINNITSHILGGEIYKPVSRQLVANIIFRSQNCFTFYEEAKEFTERFLRGSRPGAPAIGKYFMAVSRWEAVFLNLQIALSLFGEFAGKDWQSGDKSVDDRTWKVANRIKHAADDIAKKKLNGLSYPLWLSNDGFHTISTSISYGEVADQLRGLASIAEYLEQSEKRPAAKDASLKII